MTEYSTIEVRRDVDLAEIALDRPEALNAITPQMLGELNDAVAALGADPPTVVVVTGRGRAFSAGVDLKALGDASLEGGSVGDLLDGPARALTAALGQLGAVVIAKVNGFCFTGALELALACDLVVVADDAKFGDTHAKWGLRPTWGMSQRLPRAVGLARARELSYTAATFTGAQAAEWGLACRSVPRAELDAVVDALAAEIIANSRGSLLAYKDLYRVAAAASLDEGLAYEATTSYEIADTEGRIAAFR
ncbi:MAG: enoyl-CoA hydratase/isomerase family protein [Ilumatobacteraceae bacterium]